MKKKFMRCVSLLIVFLLLIISSIVSLTQIAFAATTTVSINGSIEGRTFDGEGVLSGGGGNTRLLIDYPEPYRSEILDYLFKPNFGASYTHLKVEVGGDVNSTSGTEPSHARSQAENASPNMQRGYELWLMSEAKKRNPNIVLSCLEWGAPSWVGNMWSQNNADYLISYIKGAKSVWGLDIDYVGGNQNESFNGTSQQARDYIVNILRPTLDRNGLSNVKIVSPDILSKDWAFADKIMNDSALKNAVAVVGYHYVDGVSTANAQNCGLPIWESEGWTGIGDWSGALNLAREMNENYIKARITETNVWHLICSAYDNVAWPGSGVMSASTPWSGYYAVRPAVWAAAHTNQFAQPGWKYIDSGCLITAANNSIVTLKKPDGSGNYSIIAVATADEAVTFTTNGLSTGVVHVWKSNSSQQFIQQSDITPGNGSFTVNLEKDSIYSFTTTTGQSKGAAVHGIPAQSPFPSSYSDDFESYSVGATPKYTQDEVGAFEVCNKYGSSGKALRQVVSGPLLEWDSWGPVNSYSTFTQLGDLTWQDYDYSADVLIENSGTAYIAGRLGTNPRIKQQDNLTKGYKLVVNETGNWSLRIGDPWTPVQNETQLASGTVPFSANTWHNLKLSFTGNNIKAFIDNVQVASSDDYTLTSGMAGLGSGTSNYAQYDNLTITPANSVNLTMGKAATSSSNETTDFVAGNAVDGSATTRWASQYSDPQWIYADLGKSYNINKVRLNWEAAYGKSYKIQVSNDAASWTDVYSTTTGDGGIDIITFNPVSARYVRMYGTARGTGYGYSLWEFEVYESLAVNKQTYSSSNENATFSPNKAVDGNMSTRWSSAYSDPQWIYLDLGQSYSISMVRLNWEAAYGKSYQIQVSSDASNWTTVYSTTTGDGGIDDISFTPVGARYVRMYGTARGTGYGYSLWEFEVY